MPNINYENRRFASRSNTSNGEVDASTVFHYRQRGGVVWATYEGGGIVFGTLIARVGADDSLDMRYSHINIKGEIMTGICRSIPETLNDGRLRLHETWTWASGDESSGTSIIEEIRS